MLQLAILTNKPYDNCETFVKAHIDKLPFAVKHYFGAKFPYSVPRPIPHTDLLSRVRRRILKPKPVSDVSIFVEDLKKRNVQVVLAEYGTVGADVLPAIEALQIPLVVHFHGHDAVRHSVLDMYSKKYEAMFAYPKLTVISVSHEMTKRLVQNGCPAEKIQYNTYGPADAFLDIQPSYDTQQFISIGRFVEKKAPHLLLLAFQKVLAVVPEATLVYAGDGPLLDSSKDLVQALQMEQSVSFPEHIQPKLYREYLTHSLAYVQHSIEAQDGDMEGTPVSILEASGAGLAIVSTEHAGIPDVIVHDETGLLGPERNIEIMAANMISILQDSEKAALMGKAGKKRISRSYTQRKHIDGLAAIIKNTTTS